VPGKVLGGGEMDHKITISAFRFSESAKSKLEKTGSRIIPIHEITNERGVRIIG
jgi:large subunit ribosomal protein L18e